LRVFFLPEIFPGGGGRKISRIQGEPAETQRILAEIQSYGQVPHAQSVNVREIAPQSLACGASKSELFASSKRSKYVIIDAA
jgi:hypothetical protein